MMDDLEGKLKSLKQPNQKLLKEDGDIKEVKSIDDLHIVHVLGKGAFGVVSEIIYNGQKYALKAID